MRPRSDARTLVPRAAQRFHRLAVTDVADLAVQALRAKPLRVVLSAFGIAVGVAAMVSVVGISASGQADVAQRLASIGTNVLVVTPKEDSGPAVLHDAAAAMAARVDGVQAAAATGTLPGHVYRNDHVPPGATNGIAILAVRADILGATRTSIDRGTWFTAAAQQARTVVLGAATARDLGIARLDSRPKVWLDGRWFTVIGILSPSILTPDLDHAALVGWSAATELGLQGHPDRLYVRAEPDRIGRTRLMLARAVNPISPRSVSIDRPSDALAAKAVTSQTLSNLLLGLGGVALFVGGIGVANTMVVSVLERRGEIGLRRALGARRGHIRLQFVVEAVVLSAVGGVAGAALGCLVSLEYARWREWPFVIPPALLAAAVAMTAMVGAVAGLYPAARAARTPPTAALST